MSLYIYRSKPSTGATDLAEALDGVRFRGRTIPIERKVKKGDIVVCWGEAFTNPPEGVKVLNGAAVRSKLEDALKLREAGVSTIEVSRTRPTPQTPQPPPPDPAVQVAEIVKDLAGDFADIDLSVTDLRGQLFKASVNTLLSRFTELNNAVRIAPPVAPPVVLAEWLARSTNHVGGADLLHPEDWTTGYFSKKEEFIKEFRIHSFRGKSIRAGVKDIREGWLQPEGNGAGFVAGNAIAHPWIRSWEAGWRIKYDGISSKKKHRDLAHEAVKALGLDFGAVDIGERADGTLVVLEVNRAPGLKEGTIDVYANAITAWTKGEE